jgi:ATP-binding cassette subfamily B protein
MKKQKNAVAAPDTDAILARFEGNEPKTPARRGRGPGGGGPMGAMAGGAKAKDFKGSFKRLLKALKPIRFRLLIVMALVALTTAAEILIPKFFTSKAVNILSKQFLPAVLGGDPVPDYLDRVLALLIAGAVIYAASFLLRMASGLVMAGAAQKVTYRMRKELSEKLTRVPLSFYDGNPHGDTLARITSDIATISNTLQQSLTQVIESVITVIGVLIMMFTINVTLTLVTLAVVPVTVVLSTLVMRAGKKHFKATQKYMGAVNAHVEEMISGHRVVKAFSHEPQANAELDVVNNKLYQAGWRAQFLSGFLFPVVNFTGNLAYVGVSVLGMYFVTQGKLGAGDVLALVTYSNQFMQPLSQLAQITNVIQSTVAAAERVFEVMDAEEERADVEVSAAFPRPRGRVSFSHVAFSYTPDVPLMSDVSLEVKPGQIAAIVGPTGAGKTTVVNLLMRFYELNGGKIEIDGVDTTTISRAALRKNIGMVLQDTWLFAGSVAENVAYGRPDASPAQIKDAAWAAEAHRFIKKLPGQYDAKIDEEAGNLSQGQKQLLTIARALLADPAILVLDEATSSVDTITEMHIQGAMQELMRGRTAFVIAHRLSTIKNADVILVMDKGNIIESGTHDSLLAQNGMYATLYNAQFAEE